MHDPTMSEALKEAYVCAPSGQVTLHTLEIWHPDFTDPIRVVRNYEDLTTWQSLSPTDVQPVIDALDAETQELVGLVARLETDAPRDAGSYVPFIALGFDLDLPPVMATPLPEMQLTMDNVGREVTGGLDAAATSQDGTEVIYRPYLSTDISTPQLDPPLALALADVDVDPIQISGRVRMLDVGNKSFPSEVYTLAKYPGLAQ